MVRRGGRFMRFVATTNAQVEKEMELEASHPFYGESVEYAQMRQERERQRAVLDQRRHRETTKPISVRASCCLLCPSNNELVHFPPSLFWRDHRLSRYHHLLLNPNSRC
jgi:hypothetical protein